MAETRFVDYHCHLDLYSDFPAVFRECDEQNIYVLAVTTTPAAWPRNRELMGGTASIRIALGLHPQLVAERSSELTLFERYLTETAFVGEVGLDARPRFYRSFQLQLEVFDTIVALCAAAGRKVLSIHSVRATSKVLDLVAKHVKSERIAVVLHWFSGSKAEAKRALELGCYFSTNRRMLETPHGRAIAETIPSDRILTETDGPFVSINDRPMRPADIAITLRELAEVRGVTVDAIKASVAANADLLDNYAGVK